MRCTRCRNENSPGDRDAFRFVPFAIFYMGQPVKLDYVWAGLCMCGAVYFMFRS